MPVDYLVQQANSVTKPYVGLFNPDFSPSFRNPIAEAKSQFFCPPCRIYMAVGECENGHTFAKELYCGREWCLKCRHEVHLRRIARWLPKAQQMKSLGYIVITFPMEMRDLLRDKRHLSFVGKRTTAILKDMGYVRGLRRWHFFGDKSDRYHPHLNILIEGQYLPPAENKRKPEPGTLEYLTKRLRNGLIPKGLRAAIPFYASQHIHYDYLPNPGQKYDGLRYVTRATFLDYEWDESLAMNLHGFRNAWSWGKWGDSPQWEVAPRMADSDAVVVLADLAQGICPVCKLDLSWRMESSRYRSDRSYHCIASVSLKLGAGYWRLPNCRPKGL